MFSSKWPYYLRNISCALLFLLLFRFILNRRNAVTPPTNPAEDTKRGFLQAFDENDELLKYSNVYFIESSAPFRSVATIEPRHACSIEAAARANPRKNIVVLLAAWIDFTEADNLRIPDILALASFPNVYFRWLDLERFAQNTPVSYIIKSESLYERPDGVEYLSEILRLVLLYRFGGIYLDLDVVTLKALDFYHPNFFGAENYMFASMSVMGIERSEYGQSFMESCLRDIEYFDEQNVIRNGTILMTNNLLKSCEKATVQEIVDDGCFGRLEVYSRNLFHPFDESNVGLLFEAGKLDVVKEMIAESMTVHMLHHYSGNMKIDVNGETGYELIAKSYCPSVYSDNAGNL